MSIRNTSDILRGIGMRACLTCILLLSACRSARLEEDYSDVGAGETKNIADLVITNDVSTNMTPADAASTDAALASQTATKMSTDNVVPANTAFTDAIKDEAVPASTSAVPPLAAEGAMGGLLDKSARLKPGLTLYVKVLVLGKTEIDEQNRRVSDEGFLMLPLIGSVKVDGMSLSDLAAELTERYRNFFRLPEVVVDYVMEQGTDAISPWGYVTVLGRVKRSGRVSIPPTKDMTVSAAIQRAGGLDSSARDSAIRVTRRKDDGTFETVQVDLRSVGSRGATGNDLMLRHGDVVFVPEMIF